MAIFEEEAWIAGALESSRQRLMKTSKIVHYSPLRSINILDRTIDDVFSFYIKVLVDRGLLDFSHMEDERILEGTRRYLQAKYPQADLSKEAARNTFYRNAEESRRAISRLITLHELLRFDFDQLEDPEVLAFVKDELSKLFPNANFNIEDLQGLSEEEAKEP